MKLPPRRNPDVLSFAGPAFWARPDGSRGGFVPTAPARLVTIGRMSNPIAWHNKGTWFARLFVGLHVGGAPRWSQKDVENAVKNLGAQGVSFVSQSGLFQGLPEPSVEITIFNVPPLETSPSQFRRDMLGLGEFLARAFDQDEVIVEVQKSPGRTFGMRP